MVYTPENSLDRTNLLKGEQVLVIINAEIGRNKVGSFVDVTCTDGKTYRTFSKYLLEDIKELEKNKNFNFSDGFAVEVKQHVAEESGNTYLTFETPSKDDLDRVLKQYPMKSQAKVSKD